MRMPFIAAAAFLASSHALSAPLDHGPQASLFVALGFDQPTTTAAQPARFGLRLDHEARQHIRGGAPPLLELAVEPNGFQALNVSGAPVLSRELILRQNEEGGALDYLQNNFGWIALGVGAAIVVYAAADGSSSSDDRDLDDVSGPGAPRDNGDTTGAAAAGGTLQSYGPAYLGRW
jgi:hypothetical protein